MIMKMRTFLLLYLLSTIGAENEDEADIADQVIHIRMAENVGEKAQIGQRIGKVALINAEKVCACPAIGEIICRKGSEAEEGEGEYNG